MKYIVTKYPSRHVFEFHCVGSPIRSFLVDPTGCSNPERTTGETITLLEIAGHDVQIIDAEQKETPLAEISAALDSSEHSREGFMIYWDEQNPKPKDETQENPKV